jgi:tetratricopeptide (TPR) repeat protein
LGAAEVLLQTGRDAAAVKQLREAAQLDPDNIKTLILAAQVLAASEDASARDGQTALMLAFRANDLTAHTQSLVFDAMGMACAEVGDFTNAQACAQTAIRLGASLHLENLAPLQERLTWYQRHQPWRQSFREGATEAPIRN